MTTVGLDLSLTRTGICVLSETSYRPESFVTKPNIHLRDRIAMITQFVLQRLHVGCNVFIEGYSFGSFGGQQKDRIELAGVIKQALWLANVPFLVVAPTTLKKYVSGKGNTEKPLMLHCVAKRFGVECANDDEADATGLADFGWHVIYPNNPRRQLLAYEQEAIANFVNPKPKKSRKKVAA